MDEEAIATYKEILSFEKGKSEVYLYLAMTYLNKKDYPKAETLLKDALSRFGDNDELIFNLAIVFDKTNRFEEMEKYLKKVIEINPKHADALNYLGYSYADRGINLDEALSMIKSALDLRPDSGHIIDSLGWVYFKLGQYDDALKALHRAAEIVQDDPVILDHIGDAYNSKGLTDKAREYWKKAIKFHEKEEGLKEKVEKKIQQLQ